MKLLLPLQRALLAFAVFAAFSNAQAETKLNILLVNGGCCHDYDEQGLVIKNLIESSLKAEVTIAHGSTKKPNATFAEYESDDWAEFYDLIIHNECSARVSDLEYIERVLNAHLKGVPAINIHCAMHSYRRGDFKNPVELGADNAKWFEMIGLQSSGHGPRAPVDVTYENVEHPVITGLEDWTTPVGELYNNIQIFDTATVLAKGAQTIRDKRTPELAIVWTNEYGPDKTRIISLSIGHTSEEMLDENFEKLLIRSALWATDNINADGSAKNGLAM
ncbi:MAG: ThuA domain-containing protein [Opitutales bacterium]